ncbi:hypothetical protein FFLO_00751 [Filobasidium floriforme]|uniref:Uncharacterized protein n=1 Tax=Filobasidium floriforme TaxID=5210 RepID=A0A8K0NVD8_9TREE|nr:uncharacterized protein HD553DRAFT_310547 [Filobasidium floriforme]KAG7571239.1 hypothetical protein FFLO_00751 [Filobasidium floriforme]KAH8085886.1 hypothetical protein HD553DRAFT_310547 [Filobasidium floriforme]
MLFKTLLVTALVSLTSVHAQAAVPDPTTVPAACATQCADIIETATLCTREYGSTNETSLAACLCSSIPPTSALNTCTKCLDSNSAGSLSDSLAQLPQVCEKALDSCAFECDFPTCDAKDVDCQCGEDYLQNIFNCASCNSKNGNTGATTLTNYNELKNSCVNQNYTEIPSSTEPLPSPTGQDGYVAPTLSGASSTRVASSTGRSSSTAPAASTSASARSSASNTASSVRSAAQSAAAGTSPASTSAGAIPASSTNTPANSGFKISSPGHLLGGAGLMMVIGLAGLI